MGCESSKTKKAAPPQSKTADGVVSLTPASPTVSHNQSPRGRDLKIIALGEFGSGKTSLFVRLVQNAFQTDAPLQESLKITYSTPSGPLPVRYWDSGGTEKFRCLTSSYYRGVRLALVTIDLTSGDSFFDVDNHIQEYKRSVENAKYILVGTKADLKNQRVVDADALKELSQKLGAKYVETSSKDGIGFDQLETAIKEALLSSAAQ